MCIRDRGYTLLSYEKEVKRDMKRTLIICMITGMTIPHMIDTENTKTATQSRQETTTETTVNSSLNGIDMTGFETEIYYINSAEDFDRCTYAVQNRNGKIIIEVVHAVVSSDNGDARITADGNYIKYSADDVKIGDMMETVLVYNPSNNYIDDVMYRADTFLE